MKKTKTHQRVLLNNIQKQIQRTRFLIQENQVKNQKRKQLIKKATFNNLILVERKEDSKPKQPLPAAKPTTTPKIQPLPKPEVLPAAPVQSQTQKYSVAAASTSVVSSVTENEKKKGISRLISISPCCTTCSSSSSSCFPCYSSSTDTCSICPSCV